MQHTLRKITELVRDYISAEEYSYKNGYMQRIRGDVKILGTLFIIFLVISAKNLPFLLLILFFSISLAHLSKISLKAYVSRFYFIPVFSLIVVFPLIFLMDGEVIWNLYGISVTHEGVEYVMTFFVRVSASVSCISLLLFTTKTSDLLHSMKRLRVPSHLVNIMGIVYRYLFTFLNELRDMLLGWESRNIRGERSLRGSIKFAGNFFARVMRKSENIYMAMKARGFDGNIKTYPREIKWNIHTFIYITTIFVIAVLWMEL